MLIFLLSSYLEDEQERACGLQNISPKFKQGPPTFGSAKGLSRWDKAGMKHCFKKAFIFLSCVVEILLQKRLMLPEGEALFGM